jgi:hypothetical protein
MPIKETNAGEFSAKTTLAVKVGICYHVEKHGKTAQQRKTAWRIEG